MVESMKNMGSNLRGSSPPVKAGVRAIFSNGVAGQAKPETVSATPVKAWGSTKIVLTVLILTVSIVIVVPLYLYRNAR